MATLEEEKERLNQQQAEAVDTLDGPLLVIAGPGTGKTQILGLRAANIVANRDVSPENVLCLTYTDAGALAMRSRLVRMCGRAGHGFEVCTFHGFAELVRSRYPEFFDRPKDAKLVTSLEKAHILDGLLRSLPYASPLSGIQEGKASALRSMDSLIGALKRNGITPAEFAVMANQDLATVCYLQENSQVEALATVSMRGKAATKIARADEFANELFRALAEAPTELTETLRTPHVPYLSWLARTIRQNPLIDDDGKADSWNALMKAIFDGGATTGRTLKQDMFANACTAASVYAGYQEALAKNHLYDFDDMVMDLVSTLENSSALREELQARYEYIQVDEFQDTNGAQLRIVDALCEGREHPNIMVVGDDDQAIMGFQGASLECIRSFRDNYRPVPVVLTMNYRSTPAIVGLGGEIAEGVAERMVSGTDKEITAFRPQEGETDFPLMVFPDKDSQYLALAQELHNRINNGTDGADIAVISPKHAGLRKLIPYLASEGVPFSYKERAELFGMESMQTTLSLVRCVSALAQGRLKRAEAELPHLLVSQELGGTREKAVAFAAAAAKSHTSWLSSMKDYEDQFIHSLYEDITKWATQAAATPLRKILDSITTRSQTFYAKAAEADPLANAQFHAGLAAIVTFAESECDDPWRPLTVIETAALLEEAHRLDVRIDASIGLSAPGAIHLVTAHGSKGLEYEWVYLLDCDDGTWHRRNSGTATHGPNLIVGSGTSEDDVRRLAFVAVTRARTHLSAYRAGKKPLRELDGLLKEESGDTAANAQTVISKETEENGWLHNYQLDTPELKAMVLPRPVRQLSASSLNTFATYCEGCLGGAAFAQERILCLPSEPSINLDFGNAVHAYLEDIVTARDAQDKVDTTTLDALTKKAQQTIAAMDYDEADVGRFIQRFKRIRNTFVPKLLEDLQDSDVRCEVPVFGITKIGTPLFGKCDLLIIDKKAREIQVVDYKTGHNYPKGQPDAAYERQLRFYRLLLESSTEFHGYHVVHAKNSYVEPDPKTGSLRESVTTSVADEHIAHLEALADAVWRRAQTCDLDTSAFETSAAYEQAIDDQKSASNKDGRARIMQKAYEDWLIAY